MFSFSGSTLNIVIVTTHISNLIYVLVDMFVAGIPVRMLHFYQPMTYGAMYAIFAIIYWKCGGKNESGKGHIYDLIDYDNSPGMAIAIVLGLIFIIVPLVHSVMFGFYKLRVRLYEYYIKFRNIAPMDPL